jgi:polyisoprenoid-binding protein YceI
MSGAYRIRRAAAVLVALVIAGCSGQPSREPATPAAPAEAAAASGPPIASVPREGRAFRVDPAQSILVVRVYRGGPLARAGHNHVIASHDLNGFVYVPDDPLRSTFDIRVPVQTLTVDEDTLRAQEGADFPPNVPEDAREGTRRNMLGASLLNAERYPGIGLQSENLQRVGDSVVAQVRVIVRNHASSLRVPVSYELRGNVLRVQGDIAVRQTDLGLTPFSLFGGALRVEDEMRVRFRIVARAESAP